MVTRGARGTKAQSWARETMSLNCGLCLNKEIDFKKKVVSLVRLSSMYPLGFAPGVYERD